MKSLDLGWNSERIAPVLTPGVEAMDLGWNADGNLVGAVRWAPAPKVVFHLVIAPDGRLMQWRATADPGTGLSARQLRAAPIGTMTRAVRAEAAFIVGVQEDSATSLERKLNDMEPAGTAEHAATLAEMRAMSASLQDFADRPRTGPTGRSDLSYAELSKLYLNVIEAGEPRPIRAVASQVHLSEKTVQNHLFKARERGLLTSLGRGKAGGQLTDKAKEMLSGHNQAP